MRTSKGRFFVYPASPQVNTTYFAVGFGWTRSTIFRKLTPSHRLSSRDHAVTQWKSAVSSTFGSVRNCSHVNVVGVSTSPSTRRAHVFGSNLGTMPRSRRGHPIVVCCPGGRRGVGMSRAQHQAPKLTRRPKPGDRVRE